MEEERRRAAVERARSRLSAGDDLDTVLATLRATGLSDLQCVHAVHDLLDVSLGRARALVHLSPAVAGDRDGNDAGPESLVGALDEVNRIAALQGGGPVDGPVGDSAQRLGDFRAALALALGMVVTERDPAGRAVLVVPTDGEILDEVRRLRGLCS
ncbi:hypothetical protein [Micromonospora sp. WMMD812]|uniref:hypothetical protein n=1 Tax=Micromonospora sp. WMMD812 TaxID=3015152 RepID=UPI00248B78A5|nr:hypothetical protein [Micromonospora sp. WMMD812]WBB68373.1 hypothetical protein O7603_03060 [Micromonospora sp. WMMD812]